MVIVVKRISGRCVNVRENRLSYIKIVRGNEGFCVLVKF